MHRLAPMSTGAASATCSKQTAVATLESQMQSALPPNSCGCSARRLSDVEAGATPDDTANNSRSCSRVVERCRHQAMLVAVINRSVSALETPRIP